MKILIKAVVIAILVAILLVFLAIKYTGCNQRKAQKQTAKAKQILQHPQAVPVKVFKDGEGDTHLQVLANAGQIPADNLKDTAVTNNTFVDTAAKKIGIKPEQLQELTRDNLQLKAENLQLKTKGAIADSLYSYADKWLQLDYYIKTHQANVIYHVNITTGKFTPGSWLPFLHKPAMLDFSTDDPRAVINGVEHFSAIIPQPFFGLTGELKAYYDLDTRQINPTISAGIRFGRFKVDDNFYYNQRLKQAIGFSYYFLRVNP